MSAASIIVPAYQRIQQTLQTIQFLLASSAVKHIGLEVIVADSTPGEDLRTAIENAFGTRVRYTRPDNPGIASNKNQGARIASHPLIIFCDSDIEVEPDTLIRTVEFLRTHPTAGAMGGTVLWRGGTKDAKPDRPRSEDRIYRHDDTVYVEAIYSRYIATYKDIFWNVGGYDESVFNMRGEGSDLSARFWRAGYPLTYNKDVVVHHVYDAPDSAAIRVSHPEWGVARDLLLLAYKYGMLDKTYSNFIQTVAANFQESVAVLDAFRHRDQPSYPFPFLEVFSDTHLLHACLASAQKRTKAAWAGVFGTE